MRLLLDTNIIVDVLRKRDEDYDASRLLLALAKIGEFEAWISPSQLSDLFYVLTCGGKQRYAQQVREELQDIMTFVHVCTFGDEDAQAALSLPFDDLEDALVAQAATSVKASVIVTRNQADFEHAKTPAKSSSELFDWIAADTGIHYAEIALLP